VEKEDLNLILFKLREKEKFNFEDQHDLEILWELNFADERNLEFCAGTNFDQKTAKSMKFTRKLVPL